MRSREVSEVRGKIMTADGKVTDFVISAAGYAQWGGTTEELGAVVGAVADMTEGVREHMRFRSEDAG